MKPCNYPGCGVLVTDRYCKAHRKAVLKSYDMQRETATARGYTHRWALHSKSYLKKNPLCVQCNAEGRVTPAAVTDHIIPANSGGDFWDPKNHQGLCARHHNLKTANEDGGFGRPAKDYTIAR